MARGKKGSKEPKNQSRKGKIAFDRDMENMPYKHLRKVLVETGTVTSVRIKEFGDELIELEKSWEELALLLLMMVHDTYPTKFLNKLLNKGILHGDLDITSGEFKTIEETEYRVVKIPRTVFKMKYAPKGEVLVRLIIGCGVILEYADEDMKLNLSPRKGITPVFREAKIITVTESLDKLMGNVVDSAKIHSINYNGRFKKVSNMYEAVRFVLLEVMETYGDEVLKKLELHNNRGVGLTTNENLECIKVEELVKDKTYLYYNNSVSNGIKFIGDVANTLGVDLNTIMIQITQVY